MLALIAFIPILLVVILMAGFNWPSTRAMPLGFGVATLIAIIFWKMPILWILACMLSAVVNMVDILIIIFGALLILAMLQKSGGIDAISDSMAYVSTDRRIQAILIGFLMGGFIEGATGYGTPAAVCAPLLVGIGFPPLVAATVALIMDSAPVSYGAVGTPILLGMANLEQLIGQTGFQGTFYSFLSEIGGYVGIINFFIGLFIPLVGVSIMTIITDGTPKPGLKMWKLSIFAGILLTLPQALIAYFIGPELPALGGALIALPIFIKTVQKGYLVPDEKWDFPDSKDWSIDWGQKVEMNRDENYVSRVSVKMAWLPYIIIGTILLITRLDVLPVKSFLMKWKISFDNILGTDVSNSFRPLFSPGILPFILVALIIPYLHKMEKGVAKKVWKDTLIKIKPTSIALFFALSMTYVMMNSGGSTGDYSMLITIARTLADAVGSGWYLVSPYIGSLGAFISGSATVSNIMFGGLQVSAAQQASLPIMSALTLQCVGAAAGNMICVHNIVAALTTVNLVGKEGKVIRTNISVSLIYCLLAGLLMILGVVILKIPMF